MQKSQLFWGTTNAWPVENRKENVTLKYLIQPLLLEITM